MTWKSKFASALTEFDIWEILNTESVFYWLGGMFKDCPAGDLVQAVIELRKERKK